MLGVENQLVQAMNPPRHFAAQTGLEINYTKYVMVPLNVTPDKTYILVNIQG